MAGSAGIFFTGYRDWVRGYDYRENVEYPAFQWLQEDWLASVRDQQGTFQPWIIALPNRYVNIVEHAGGIDLAVDFGLDAILADSPYHTVMTHVAFPEYIRRYYYKGISDEENWLAFFQSDQTEYDETPLFFTLDYDNQEIREYCSTFSNPGRTFFSPDRHFAAFPTGWVDRAKNKAVITTVVIDLESGYYARVPDFSMQGWIVRE